MLAAALDAAEMVLSSWKRDSSSLARLSRSLAISANNSGSLNDVSAAVCNNIPVHKLIVSHKTSLVKDACEADFNTTSDTKLAERVGMATYNLKKRLVGLNNKMVPQA